MIFKQSDTTSKIACIKGVKGGICTIFTSQYPSGIIFHHSYALHLEGTFLCSANVHKNFGYKKDQFLLDNFDSCDATFSAKRATLSL